MGAKLHQPVNVFCWSFCNADITVGSLGRTLFFAQFYDVTVVNVVKAAHYVVRNVAQSVYAHCSNDPTSL